MFHRLNPLRFSGGSALRRTTHARAATPSPKKLAHLYTNPQALVGKNVFVYRNLNQDAWSVRCEEGEDRGYIVAHAQKLLLKDARFVVHASWWL
jgi:hypothetical protein